MEIIRRFTPAEMILAGFITLLLVLVFLLLVYALYLRVRHNMHLGRLAGKQREWERLLLLYLSGDLNDDNVRDHPLDFDDWMDFGGFIEGYLLDIKGEDREAVVRFVDLMGFSCHLVAALDSKDQWERIYSAFYLGQIGYAPAEEKLREHVYDSSPLVSVNAVDALNRIGSTRDLHRIIKYVLGVGDIGMSRMIDIVGGYGGEIDGVLLRLLDDNELSERALRIVIDVLASRNVLDAVPKIMSIAYKTSNTELIIGCIKALGEFGEPESLDFLMAHLSSPNWVVRSQAVRALGSISSPLIIPELKIRLQMDENYWVRLYSAQTIARFGKVGVRELERLKDQNLRGDVESIIAYVLYELED